MISERLINRPLSSLSISFAAEEVLDLDLESRGTGLCRNSDMMGTLLAISKVALLVLLIADSRNLLCYSAVRSLVEVKYSWRRVHK